MASVWNEELKAEALRLWNDDKSYTQIAEALGMSRGQVSGQLDRLGASRCGSSEQARRTRIAVRRYRARERKAKAKTLSPKARIVYNGNMVRDNMPRNIAHPDAIEAVCELTLTSCRWPMGNPSDEGFRFCGESAEAGRPYCPDHQKAAYLPPKPKED